MQRCGVWLALLWLLTATGSASDAIRIDVRARAVQPGELVVLTVTTQERIRDVRVRALDRDIPAFRIDGRTWRALIGIDLDVKPGSYEVTVQAAPGAAPATERLRVAPH